MGLPPFEARVRRLATELFAPDPPPRPEVKADKAWIDVGRGGLWGTHGTDKLTRLTLLAHKYRLYAQIQLLDTGLRLLLLPRSATPEDSLFHPGLGDLVARAYAMAGRSPPMGEACDLLRSLLSLAETFAPEEDLAPQEAQAISSTRTFLERNRP